MKSNFIINRSLSSRLIILFILSILIGHKSLSQNFGFFASAIDLNVNGVQQYYNTFPGTLDVNSINPVTGAPFFSGNLGTFVSGSGLFNLKGGEIKTFKNSGGNVCGATLFYRIYKTGDPAPSFSALTLPFFSNCSGSTFPDAGGGPCGGNDQKWGTFTESMDLTQRCPGNYSFEIFYAVAGSSSGGGCSENVYDSNNSTNYIASFDITSNIQVVANSNSSLCEGNTLNLNASVTGGNPSYTYLWNGPSGFTSTDASPVVPNAQISSSGTYYVAVTDGCNNILSAQTDVTVNAIPVAAPSSNSPSCSGTFINLFAADAGVGAVYGWTGPNSFNSAIQNPQRPYSASNEGTYTLTVTSPQGCIATATTDVVCSALPVRLVSFNGEAVEDVIHLQWEAVDASDFSYFDVERSIDAKTFDTIKRVYYGSQKNYYALTDSLPLTGTNYYRLNMVDNDGSNAYSRSIKVRVGSEDTKYAYLENPSNSDYIHLFTNTKPLSAHLIDKKGNETLLKLAQVSEKEWLIESGKMMENQVSIIRITGKNETLVRKFIKTK